MIDPSLIVNGVEVANPAYDKKTKQGRLQPQTLTEYDITKVPNEQGWMQEAVKASIKYGKDVPTIDWDKYTKYGIIPNVISTEEELNKERAKNQRWTEQAGHSIAQLVENEVLVGTALGFSNIYDVAASLITGQKIGEYASEFTKFLEEVQETNRERLAIYAQNPNESLQFGDFAWWANNFINVGSTASLLIPSTTAAKAASLLGKGLKTTLTFGKIGKNQSLTYNILKKINNAKVARGAKEIEGIGLKAKKLETVGSYTMPAVFSRTMENFQEAREVYKDSYDYALNQLNSMSDEQYKLLIENNENYKNMSKEDIAKDIAGMSSEKTFYSDYAMLLMDVLQMRGISKIGKSVKAYENAALRRTNKELIGSLIKNGTNEAEKAALKKQLLTNLKDNIKELVRNPFNTIEALSLSEAVEEGYQGIASEKGKEVAKLLLDPEYTERSLGSYLTDGSIWEQAMWGVIGGIVFQGVGKAGRRGYQVGKAYYKKATSKDRIEDHDFEKMKWSDTKIRQSVLEDNLKTTRQLYDKFNKINEGYNPFEFEVNSKGEVVKDSYGEPVNKKLQEGDADVLRKKIIDEYLVDRYAANSEAGLSDLFREFVSSPELAKAFRENGIFNEEETAINKIVTERFERVANTYDNAFYDIYANADVQNDYVAKALAKTILRDKLYLEQVNEYSNDLDNRISAEIAKDNDANINDYNNYLQGLLFKEITRKLYDLDDEVNKLNNDVRSGNISEEAAKYRKAEINRIRKQLFSNSINIINEDSSVSIQPLDSKASDSDIDAKTKEFYDNIDNIKVPDKSKLNNTVLDLYDEKVTLQITKDIEQSQLPVTQQEYQEAYDEMSFGFDKYVKNKVEQAKDTIIEYLEQSEDVDKAWLDVLNNRTTGKVKEASDLLKIGSWQFRKNNQELFLMDEMEIKTAMQAIKNDRAAKARKAEQTTSEGNTVTGKEKRGTEKKIKEIKDNIKEEKDTKEKKEKADKKKKTVHSTGEKEDKEIITIRDFMEDRPGDETVADVILNDRPYNEKIALEGKCRGIIQEVLHNAYIKNREQFKYLFIGEENSPIYNELVNSLLTEVNKSEAIKLVNQILPSELKEIAKAFADRNTERSREFQELALKMSVLKSYSSTEEFTKDSEEFTELANKFIEEYFKDTQLYTSKLGDKVVVDLEHLFNTLLDSGLDTNIVSSVLDSLAQYINDNEKYIFTNRALYDKFYNNPYMFFVALKEKSVAKKDNINLMRLAGSILKDIEEINNIIERLRKHNKHDRLIARQQLDVAGNKIGISFNLVNTNGTYTEVAFIQNVDRHSDNSGYEKARIHFGEFCILNNSGFIFDITEKDGNLTTNIDYLFDSLFEALDDKRNNKETENTKLLDILMRLNIEGRVGGDTKNTENRKLIPYDTKKRQANKEDIEMAKTILTNDLIKQLKIGTSEGLYGIDGKSISIGKDNSINILYFNNETKQNEVRPATDRDICNIANRLVQDINSILFYTTSENKNYNISALTASSSYYEYVESLYQNFKQTEQVQIALENNPKSQVSYEFEDFEKVIYPYTDTPTSSLSDLSKSINALDNPIAIVDGNEVVIEGEKKPKNLALSSTSSASMGIVLDKRGDTPKVLWIGNNGMNKLVDEKTTNNYREELIEAIRTELTNLIKNYQYGKIQFTDLADALGQLLGGTHSNRGGLFTGASIISNNSFIGINFDNTKIGKDNIDIGFLRYAPKSTNEYFSIAIKEEETEGLVRHKNITDGFINQIVDSILNSISFNMSHYMFKANTENDNNGNNRYYRKENNKLNITIGGKTFNFNSFSQFMYDMNAITLNIANENGQIQSVVTTPGRTPSIYISTDYSTSPVKVQAQTIDDVVSSATDKRKSVLATDLLQAANVSSDNISLLLGKNVYGLSIIDEKVYYDKTKDNVDSYYGSTTDKIYLTKRGIERVKNGDVKLTRLLIHEKIHKTFTQHNAFARKELVDELIKTHEAFIKGLSKDNESVNNWVKKNGYDSIDNYMSKHYPNITDEQAKRQKFAEEWITDSLTYKELSSYLQTAAMEGVNVDITAIADKDKNIFQKIIEILLKLFGINLHNPQKNSIFAQQYKLLGDIEEVKTSPQKRKGTDPVSAKIDKGNKKKETKKDAETQQLKIDLEQNSSLDSDTSTNQTIEKTEEEPSIEEKLADKYSQRETFEPEDDSDDDVSYSATEEFETVDDAIIKEGKDNNGIVMGNVINVGTMEHFVDMFPQSQKLLIAKNIAFGGIKYVC